MKMNALIIPLTVISFGISTGTLLTSCEKSKKQTSQELQLSGYEATPEEFLRAAKEGDARALKLLIQQGIDPNTRDAQGRSAIHLAAETGHQDAVSALLDAGVSINVTDPDGVTPLMLAATQGRPEMVRFLIKQGAKPELKDHLNRNALIYAIDANQPSSVEELSPYLRAELDTALLYAAAQGKFHVINTLTSFGASVYARHEGGMTPLMLAAENGHTTTVHALLQSGANRFAINEHGWTAAQVAAAANHEAIAELLSQAPEAEELAINEPSDEEGVMWQESNSDIVAVLPQTASENQPQENNESQAGSSSQVAQNDTPQKSEQPNHSTSINNGKSTIVVNTTTPAHRPNQTTPHRPKRHLPFIANQTVSTQKAEPKHPERIAQDLHMRDYHQQNLPFIIDKVTPKSVQVRKLYGEHKKVSVRQGETIPETPFKIVSVHRKIKDSKLNDGQPSDISIVEIEDTRTGKRRKLTTQIPEMASEPWAVLENTSGSEIYAARTGQTFQTSSGETYTVTDIRPSQVILTHQKTGKVITIPLGN